MKALSLIALSIAASSALAVTEKEVAQGYADLAHANYADALVTAKQLQQAVAKLVANPSQATLQQARSAWLASRPSYQQSEVFRFSNSVVDDWEGQLNAWPLDEGLIDYVQDDGYEYELGNEAGMANIIANTQINVGGESLDVRQITPDLLASLNEIGESEANVATGYHAIEFLLWGQDLNGVNAGAGERPYTDYVIGTGCTNGHCDRRGQYLTAATELLIEDLEYMVGQWQPNTANNYRAELLSQPAAKVLENMLYGMGSLALGELAGERIKVALQANSTEDEHDCFSDNTHNSHYYNGAGISNLYYGQYVTSDGKKVEVASLQDLLKSKAPDYVAEADHTFAAATAALLKIKQLAEQENTYFDQLIAPGNQKGAEVLNRAIQALVQETRVIEQIAAKVGVNDLTPDNADHDF